MLIKTPLCHTLDDRGVLFFDDLDSNNSHKGNTIMTIDHTTGNRCAYSKNPSGKCLCKGNVYACSKRSPLPCPESDIEEIVENINNNEIAAHIGFA